MEVKPVALSGEEVDVRTRAREFLEKELPADRELPPLTLVSGFDKDFSKRLGEVGLTGYRLPRVYGAAEGSSVEGFLLTEEMYAVQAPLQAHLIADRQAGPCIARFGSEFLRDRFLPLMARGEVSFTVGLSEPDAGSDLASVRAKATRSDGGWLLNGTKVWITNAHRSEFCTVLCRTSAEPDRHEGLTQFIVDLTTPGLEIRPILLLDGTHHFNEVSMRDVFVPDEMVLGQIGQGWKQAMSELVYERANPDRYMSAYPLLEAMVAEFSEHPASEPVTEAVGSLVARFWAIRNLSLGIARSLDENASPGAEVAVAKDIATKLVQEIVTTARGLETRELDPDAGSAWERRLAGASLNGPIATIGGGTSEILQTIAAKGLGNAATRRSAISDDGLASTVERIFREQSPRVVVDLAETEGWSEPLWRILAEAGIPWVGVDERSGGSGGTLEDAISVLRWGGYYALPIPLAESGILGGWLLGEVGVAVPERPVTVAPGTRQDRLDMNRLNGGWTVSGELHRVPWAEQAEVILATAQVEGKPWLLQLDPALTSIHPGRNLAGERRDSVRLDSVRLPDASLLPLPSDDTVNELRLRGALARASMLAGACQAASDMTNEYAGIREAFGRPINRFQLVQQHLVQAAGEAELAWMAVQTAAKLAGSPHHGIWFNAAKVVASRAGRTVAATAHQVHAGIGMTQEFPLHHLTRRLWAWAAEYGSERSLASNMGGDILARQSKQLWPLLSETPCKMVKHGPMSASDDVRRPR